MPINNQHVVYTDGSCLKNPNGPGGWGAIVICEESEKVLTSIYGSSRSTTNNRMELTAALMAVEHFDYPTHIVIYSDSQYVVRGMNEWVHKWKTRQFNNVKNNDLWRRLYESSTFHIKIEWKWVKGHSTNRWNNRVDQLAKRGAEEAKLALEMARADYDFRRNGLDRPVGSEYK